MIAFRLEIGGFVAIPTTRGEAEDIDQRDIFEDDLSYAGLVSCAKATEKIGAVEIAASNRDELRDGPEDAF